MSKNSFTDFLKYIPSQKEVSLILAKDENELSELTKNLEDQGFRQVVDALDLFKHIEKPTKVFFIAKESLPKDIYDFIVQYPTGQVEIYDKFNLRSQTIIPKYQDVSVVFVMTKDVLKKTQASGFQVLEQVGITYQS